MQNYYDPKKGLSGAYAYYKSQNTYTYKQIKDMIAKQEAYQLNKPQHKIAYFPIVGHGKNSYQADLMFLDEDKGFKSILCIINVITRVAYAYPLQDKSENSVYDAFKAWLKSGVEVEHLQTDRGSEFTNKKVKDLFKDINYYHVNVADHYAQGKVERFNQTLRRLISIYQSAYKTTNWVDVLPDLLDNYNNRYHRSLGDAPNNVDEDTQFQIELKKYANAEKQFKLFKVGDKVRVLLNKEKFDKGRAEWSNEVYKIEEIEYHRLLVNGKWYKHHQLQRIEAVHSKLLDDNTPLNKVAIKKEKKVVRDIRKEGIDASNIIETRSKVKEKIKWDSSLIGRRVARKIDRDPTLYKGTIIDYEKEGPYHWKVEFDVVPEPRKTKYEKMSKAELLKYFI